VNANPLKHALHREGTLTGIIVFTGSPMVVELAGAAGLDFVILDMEHSAMDLDRYAHMIRAADAAGIAPLVRVPEVDAALIKRLLNLGAAGIAVPHANIDNCVAALRAVRYAPDGERGACPIVRSAGYAPGDWTAYARNANQNVMVIPLIEDAETIRNFDGLCTLEGLDVFFIGPTDLSIALGVPGATFEDPRLGAALDKVVAVAHEHGKQVMTTVGNRLDPGYARMVAHRGVKFIVLGTDGQLLLDVCRRMNEVKTGEARAK